MIFTGGDTANNKRREQLRLKGDIALGDFNEEGNLDVAFPQSSLQIRRMPGAKVLIFFGDGTRALIAGPVLI